MNEGIKKFLNNETYILAYRSNYDSARELNQQLIDYVKDLVNRIDRTYKYVSQLSSKGRDCEIYYDIKKEILNNLKESGE